MSASQGPETIDISRLSFEQLRSLKEQLDAEVDTLTEQFKQLRSYVGRLEQSSSSVQCLGNDKPGMSLTKSYISLYVPGTLGANDTVLVEIGTGYFVEKTRADALDFFHRKTQLVQASLAQVAQIIASKGQNQEMLTMAMQQKLQASEGGGAAASSAGAGTGKAIAAA
eukprot:jgi/Mesvir1/22637/Mv14072-RA.1